MKNRREIYEAHEWAYKPKFIYIKWVFANE